MRGDASLRTISRVSKTVDLSVVAEHSFQKEGRDTDTSLKCEVIPLVFEKVGLASTPRTVLTAQLEIKQENQTANNFVRFHRLYVFIPTKYLNNANRGT